jgi:hypothetical protein
MRKLTTPEAVREFAGALQAVAQRMEAMETLLWIQQRHLAMEVRAMRAAFAALAELQTRVCDESEAPQPMQPAPKGGESRTVYQAPRTAVRAGVESWAGDLLS